MTTPEEQAKAFKEAMGKLTAHAESQSAKLHSQYEERIKDQQKLNEFFKAHAKKDSWLLIREALPIMQGIDPSEADSVGIWNYSWYRMAKELIMAAEKNKTLNIINPGSKAKEWRASPKNFAQWAKEKDLEFRTEFINLTLNSPESVSGTSKTQGYAKNAKTERHAVVREKIYIAALGCIASFPEQCKNTKGDWSPSSIAKLIEEKAPFWFGDEDAPLTTRRKSELIAKALRSTDSLE